MSSYGMFSGEPETRVPQSKLPHVWVGFVFVAAFFLAEIYELVAAGFDETMISEFSVKLIIIGLAGWVYWLYCVYKFHQVLEETSSADGPTSSKMAVVGHFIPFYNIYWVFKWPSELVSFLKSKGNVKIAPGLLLGALLFIFILTSRFFDGGIGMAGIFTIGLYINSKIKNYIQALSGTSLYSAPPPPDEKFFRPQTHVDEANSTGAFDSTAAAPAPEQSER